MNIYASLAAVMSDVDHVAKRDINTFQQFKFRGIDAVVNAVGPALRKHGVIVVPEVLTVVYDLVQTSKDKQSTACRVHVAYVFYGSEGDSIRTSVIGEAWDTGDKSAPKAMSVAFRTALIQALALPTDEPDPDSQVYERVPAPAPAPDPKHSAWAYLSEQMPAASPGEKTALIVKALAPRDVGTATATDEDWRWLLETWQRDGIDLGKAVA